MKTRAILLGLVFLVIGAVGLLYLVFPSSGPREGPSDAPPVSRSTDERAASGKASDPGPAEEVSTARDRGAISGRVLLESPREPIAGAHVAAVGEDATSYAAEALTDGEGRYELSGLAAGRYRVSAWRGHLTMRQIPRGCEWIDVASGARMEGIDLILRAGGILTGSVVDELTGRPIAAATVRVRQARFAATDAEGRFRLEGMRAGVVEVSACAGRFASRTLQVGIDPGAVSSILIGLSPGGVIEGVVTMPTGEPAVGAGVSSWSLSRSFSVQTKTNGVGRYRLDGIPFFAGQATVYAWLGVSRERLHLRPFLHGRRGAHLARSPAQTH